ncbi:hypothetical protein T484DRAFT_1830709, partial [Baffinella frigidus]
MVNGKVVFPRARRLPFMKMHRERARTAMGKTNVRDVMSPMIDAMAGTAAGRELDPPANGGGSEEERRARTPGQILGNISPHQRRGTAAVKEGKEARKALRGGLRSAYGSLVAEGRKGLVKGTDVKMALLKHDVTISDAEARDLAGWLVQQLKPDELSTIIVERSIDASLGPAKKRTLEKGFANAYANLQNSLERRGPKLLRLLRGEEASSSAKRLQDGEGGEKRLIPMGELRKAIREVELCTADEKMEDALMDVMAAFGASGEGVAFADVQ